jgi:hypothetical protein
MPDGPISPEEEVENRGWDEAWPGEELMMKSGLQSLPDLPKAPDIQVRNLGDSECLVIRTDAGKVLEWYDAGHIYSERDDPYDTEKLESDVRDEMAKRKVPDTFSLHVEVLQKEDMEKLDPLRAEEVEELTGGKRAEYLPTDKTDKDAVTEKYSLERMGIEGEISRKDLEIIREGDLNVLLNVALKDTVGIYSEGDLNLIRARIGAVNRKLENNTSK